MVVSTMGISELHGLLLNHLIFDLLVIICRDGKCSADTASQQPMHVCRALQGCELNIEEHIVLLVNPLKEKIS